MQLHKVYKKFKTQGYIQPPTPKPPPNLLLSGYDSNEHCDYHKTLGYNIDKWLAQRHPMEDKKKLLILSKELLNTTSKRDYCCLVQNGRQSVNNLYLP